MENNIRWLAILCLIGITSGQSSIPFTLWSHWQGGFVGETCFTAPVNMKGWIVSITFDVDVQKLSEIWNSELVEQVNQRLFIIKDVYYNKESTVGTRVCPGFKGLTNHNIRTTASIVFIPLFDDGQGVLPVDPTTSTAPIDATLAPPVEDTTAPPTEGVMPDDETTTEAENPSDGEYDYEDVIRMSIWFYEAQRSGELPADNRIPFRGNSALDDEGHEEEDLSGGWYDAGDYVKFNLPMASATTLLLWGMERYKDSYVATGQLDKMYDSIRWPLDYFLKCWIPEKNYYYYQVGDPVADHAYWGRAEDMNMDRPAFKLTTSSPGSDVAGETAASLAAGSIVFKTEDSAYSEELLTAARGLYTFAKTYQGKYPLYNFYVSSGYRDELCLAAIWLYKATGESSYLNDAKSFVSAGVPWALSWDSKDAACQLLLFEETRDSIYQTNVENFMDGWVSGSSVPYTTCGLAFRDGWGSLRYSANAAFLGLLAAEDGIKSTVYREWAIGQVNYMLGDNKLDKSYVIGYSNNFPTNPHHASSSCPSPPATCDWSTYNSQQPNAFVLYGALVGGPDINDNYVDDRKKYEYTEVTCDYNAGFQSAVAGIIDLKESGILPDVPARNC